MSDWKDYRKKPVVIQARRLTKTEHVRTLEGAMTGNPGDWMIRGVKGECYPCKDDIFRATYEEVAVSAADLMRDGEAIRRDNPAIGRTGRHC